MGGCGSERVGVSRGELVMWEKCGCDREWEGVAVKEWVCQGMGGCVKG